MKEKIRELANGSFHYELPEIVLSPESIEITLYPGKNIIGEFTVGNSENSHMKGIIYSDSRLLQVVDPDFSGVENRIHFEIRSEELSPGETAKGFLYLISDCGEQRIPYLVQSELPYFMTSLGKIRDLFQFANLAKTDWMEAVKLFKSKDFEEVLLKKDKKNTMLYQSLLKSISNSHGLEEFLIAVHKKFKITYTVDKTEINCIAGKDPFVEQIIIRKDNWGYGEIKVSKDAAFLIPERKLIWTDNFIGNEFILTVEVKPEEMKSRRNHGRIYLNTNYQTLIIDIKAECQKTRVQRDTEYHKRKEGQIHLLYSYMKFRMNRIDVGQYLSKTESVLNNAEYLREQDGEEEFMYTLLQTYIFLIGGRREQTRDLLCLLESKDLEGKGKILEYSALLYLEALFTKEKEAVSKAFETIRSYYEQGYWNWKLLWFLLYLDRSYDGNRQKKLSHINEHLKKGCHSPILYLEAAALYNEEPALLRELDLTTVPVINWAVREDFLSQEVLAQYTYLAGRKKQFSPLHYRILGRLYHKYGSKEILIALTGHLIKGQKSGLRYLPWYALGIKEQLRVTELYEYYMYSVEEDSKEELPLPLLHYFAYKNNLNSKKRACLYARVIENQEDNPLLYQTYKKEMVHFALEQLREGKISENLAVLYGDIMKKEALDIEIAADLPKVMFRNEIYCGNPRMKGVFVVHKEYMEECYVPLENGKALIDIYTENAGLFLADEAGNRYAETIEYTLRKLLDIDNFAETCFNLGGRDERLLLHLAEQIENYHKHHEHMVYIKKVLIEAARIQDDLKTKWYLDLIRHFNDHFEGEQLEDMLSRVDLQLIASKERCRLIEYMVIRSMHEKAMEAVKRFGCEGVGVKLLLKLWTKAAAYSGMEEKQKDLIQLGYSIMKLGKYNEQLLNYLILYFNGITKDMLEVWTKAQGFELETAPLEERILAQMLFSESGGIQVFPLFFSYYGSGRNQKLIRAFLSYYSYKYLVNDRIVEPGMFEILRKESRFEENDVGMLALLKYYSGKEDLNEEERVLCIYNLDKFIERGMTLPFFGRFKGKIPVPFSVRNQRYVEYRTNPSHKVTLHYMLESEEEQENFLSVSMKNIFGGIFVKGFTLFHNETLQYYISEEDNKGEVIMKSTTLTAVSEIEEEENKYSLINLMLIAREMQDEKTLLEIMEHFIKTEYAVEELFQPL